nr:hypothetical protein [Tanacetum cinerariifolium]
MILGNCGEGWWVGGDGVGSKDSGVEWWVVGDGVRWWRGDGDEVVAIVWGDGGVVGGDEVTLGKWGHWCGVVVLKRKYLDECI